MSINEIELARVIIEALIAFGAIGAAIFAGLTFKQAIKFKEEDQKSRQAFITPRPDPGFVCFPKEFEELECLRISLKNYGINTATRIEGDLFACMKAIDDGKEKMVDPIFIQSFHRYNSMPHTADWNISLEKNDFNTIGITDNEILIILVQYLIMTIKYHDNVLDEDFYDTFFWYRSGSGKLVEVASEDVALLRAVLSEQIEILDSAPKQTQNDIS